MYVNKICFKILNFHIAQITRLFADTSNDGDAHQLFLHIFIPSITKSKNLLIDTSMKFNSIFILGRTNTMSFRKIQVPDHFSSSLLVQLHRMSHVLAPHQMEQSDATGDSSVGVGFCLAANTYIYLLYIDKMSFTMKTNRLYTFQSLPVTITFIKRRLWESATRDITKTSTGSTTNWIKGIKWFYQS